MSRLLFGKLSRSVKMVSHLQLFLRPRRNMRLSQWQRHRRPQHRLPLPLPRKALHQSSCPALPRRSSRPRPVLPHRQRPRRQQLQQQLSLRALQHRARVLPVLRSRPDRSLMLWPTEWHRLLRSLMEQLPAVPFRLRSKAWSLWTISDTVVGPESSSTMVPVTAVPPVPCVHMLANLVC